MKYKVVYAVIVSFLLTLTSCTDYLDKESYTIITPENVWKEPKLIQAVLVNLYSSLETEGFDYWYNEAWRLQNPTSMSDEAQGSFQKAPLFDNGNATYTYEDELFGLSWSSRYNAIRNCNNFLTQLSEATSLSENEKKALIAEGRFLRAFNYFTLVKRYGGVPLITEAQKYDPSKVDSLQVSRDKEVDVYDFIVNECLAAAEDLPKTRDNNNKYRVTGGAA